MTKCDDINIQRWNLIKGKISETTTKERKLKDNNFFVDLIRILTKSMLYLFKAYNQYLQTEVTTRGYKIQIINNSLSYLQL